MCIMRFLAYVYSAFLAPMHVKYVIRTHYSIIKISDRRTQKSVIIPLLAYYVHGLLSKNSTIPDAVLSPVIF